MKYLISAMVMALALAGCASTPYAYRSTSGCKIAHFAKTWVEANVNSMQWSGVCDNKGLATASGVLEVIRKDGVPMRYEGRMLGGFFFSGYAGGQPAIYVEGSERQVGEFDFHGFKSGQVYRNEKLVFDGAVVGFDDKTLKYSKQWGVGKVYFPSGNYIDGELSADAETYEADGKGVKRAIYKKADGTIIHWIESYKVYRSEKAWLAAIESTKQTHQKRVALDDKLTLTFSVIDRSAVQAISSDNEKKLLYYAEQRDIQANKILLLDNMTSKCSASPTCSFNDLLRSRRDKEYVSWQQYDKDFRGLKASFESAAALDRAVGAVLDSGLLGAQFTNAYRAESAKYDAKYKAISNVINQLSTSGNNAGELATYVAQLYKLIQ